MKTLARRFRLIAPLLLVLAFAASASAAGKQYLWQTNSYGNDVHVIDVATNKVVKNFEVGPQPHGIAAPDDASVVYIAIEAFKKPNGELLWVDPRTYKILHRMTIGPKPNQLACTPDGRWVYVPCNDQTYWVIDGKNRTVVKKIRTGGRPHNTQASRDGKRMYLSPMGSPKEVTIVDVENGHKVIGKIPFSASVRPPALEPDGKRYFQHVDGLIGFEVADIATRKVTNRIEHTIAAEYKGKGSRCHGLCIRPDGKEIWSCNVEHKTVHIHDITKPDYPQIAALPMIGRIYWLTFSPDSKFAYIAVRSKSQVCVVDTATRKVVTHLDVGNTPKRNLVITLGEAK
jgi:YVTN family beta-propeller protein